MNGASSNFIQKLIKVIVKVASAKNKIIKRNSQEWFDSEIQKNWEYGINFLRNTKNLGFMWINRFIKKHDMVCKISLQKMKISKR